MHTDKAEAELEPLPRFLRESRCRRVQRGEIQIQSGVAEPSPGVVEHVSKFKIKIFPQNYPCGNFLVIHLPFPTSTFHGLFLCPASAFPSSLTSTRLQRGGLLPSLQKKLGFTPHILNFPSILTASTMQLRFFFHI